MTMGSMVNPALFHSLSSLRFPISGFSPPHAEHDAGGGAGAVHSYGVVDFIEWEGLGDEAVEGHFSGLDEVDEAGNLEIGGCAAAVGAFEDFFEMERERVDGDFFSGAGDSDKDGAAVGMREVVGEFDDAGVAGGVDDDIRAGFSDDFADFFGETGAFGGGVERVSESPFFGHFELGVVEVDADNGMGADHLCGLGDIESDAANAENDNALADLDLGVVVDDTYGGCHCATEERGQSHVEAGRDDGEPVLGDDGLVVECGDPAGVDGFVSPTVFGRLALESSAGSPVEDNMIARLDARHTLPYPLDDARSLVAEEVGQKFIGALGGFDLVDLSAANTAVMNADMNLAEGERVGHLEFGDFERRVGLDENGGEHERNLKFET